MCGKACSEPERPRARHPNPRARGCKLPKQINKQSDTPGFIIDMIVSRCCLAGIPINQAYEWIQVHNQHSIHEQSVVPRWNDPFCGPMSMARRLNGEEPRVPAGFRKPSILSSNQTRSWLEMTDTLNRGSDRDTVWLPARFFTSITEFKIWSVLPMWIQGCSYITNPATAETHA